MPVSLISGPINSGKTGRLLGLLSRTDPGRTGMIVVPDRAIAAALRHRLVSGSRPGPGSLRADSIQDWQGFLGSLARPTLPVAGRNLSTMIILGLMPGLALSCFGKSIRSFSLARSFARTILSLKENLVKPADLAETIQDLGEARFRERDLITVYEAYDRELSRAGFLDHGDLTVLAIRNTIERRGPLAEMEFIAFDEFTMPSPSHLAVLRALAQGLPGARIEITCPVAADSDDEAAYSAWLSRARDAWLSACGDEEALASGPAKMPEVSVSRAPSPAQEARHIAGAIAGMGLDAHEVAVGMTEGPALDYFLSEAHSMGLLPEHPTLDGARGSPFVHELLSPGFAAALPETAGAEEYAAAILAMARTQERASAWVRGLKERRGRGRVAGRSLLAASIVEEALQGLAAYAQALGAKRIKRGHFLQLFADELSRWSASSTVLESVLPFRMHRLGTPMAARSRSVFACGMTEGAFPARQVEGLFFGDWKDESISRIFPDAEDRHASESYAFETMLRKCDRSFSITLPAVDESGSETVASPFASRFLSQGAGPVPLAACVLDRTAGDRARHDRLLEIENARISGDCPKRSPLAAHMGTLRSRRARETVRKRFEAAELSATALELYANCPFSFFCAEVARAEPLPDDSPQIRAVDRGRVVHEILREFYANHQKEALAARKDENAMKRILATVEGIGRRIWDDAKNELAYVKPGLREREMAESVGMALAVIAMEAAEAASLPSPLVPRAFEWEFSAKGGNALEIKMKKGPALKVRGRVDRIDSDSDRARYLVIDYKTGREKQAATRIESGRHLQLPLYIEAVGRSLMPDAAPMGGLFVEIREAVATNERSETPGKTKGIVRDEFEGHCYRVGRAHSKAKEGRFEGLIAAALERAAYFASEIRDGRFPTGGEADCDHCNYGDICRYNRA